MPFMWELLFMEQGHKSLIEISAFDSRKVHISIILRVYEMWYFCNALDLNNNTYHDITNISQLGYKSFDG